MRDFPSTYEQEVVAHMENFGDLEDVRTADRVRGKGITEYFTYKKRRDAEKVVLLFSF